MAYDAEATQKRLDETKAAIEADKKKAAMETAGFEYAADYDQWKVLEELRKAELELRERERERKQRAKTLEQMNNNMFHIAPGGAISGSLRVSDQF